MSSNCGCHSCGVPDIWTTLTQGLQKWLHQGLPYSLPMPLISCCPVHPYGPISSNCPGTPPWHPPLLHHTGSLSQDCTPHTSLQASRSHTAWHKLTQPLCRGSNSQHTPTCRLAYLCSLLSQHRRHFRHHTFRVSRLCLELQSCSSECRWEVLMPKFSDIHLQGMHIAASSTLSLSSSQCMLLVQPVVKLCIGAFQQHSPGNFTVSQWMHMAAATKANESFSTFCTVAYQFTGGPHAPILIVCCK